MKTNVRELLKCFFQVLPIPISNLELEKLKLGFYTKNLNRVNRFKEDPQFFLPLFSAPTSLRVNCLLSNSQGQALIQEGFHFVSKLNTLSGVP